MLIAEVWWDNIKSAPNQTIWLKDSNNQVEQAWKLADLEKARELNASKMVLDQALLNVMNTAISEWANFSGNLFINPDSDHSKWVIISARIDDEVLDVFQKKLTHELENVYSPVDRLSYSDEQEYMIAVNNIKSLINSHVANYMRKIKDKKELNSIIHTEIVTYTEKSLPGIVDDDRDSRMAFGNVVLKSIRECFWKSYTYNIYSLLRELKK